MWASSGATAALSRRTAAPRRPAGPAPPTRAASSARASAPVLRPRRRLGLFEDDTSTRPLVSTLRRRRRVRLAWLRGGGSGSRARPWLAAGRSCVFVPLIDVKHRRDRTDARAWPTGGSTCRRQAGAARILHCLSLIFGAATAAQDASSDTHRRSQVSATSSYAAGARRRCGEKCRRLGLLPHEMADRRRSPGRWQLIPRSACSTTRHDASRWAQHVGRAAIVVSLRMLGGGIASRTPGALVCRLAVRRRSMRPPSPRDTRAFAGRRRR